MIEMVTPMSLVNDRIEAYAKKIEASILKKLSFIGESVVAEARSANSYEDQTGNLRTSTGYAILKDGKVLSGSSFLPVKIKATKGGKKGKALIKDLASKYSQGYVLLVVAGMDYAVYVEAMGLNVLSSSKLLAESMTKRLL
ncbi:MAG: hypothetical protein PHU69_14725 [Fermentimonas sp.]|nr:hypothetical protein [Fermentimonas sp.]